MLLQILLQFCNNNVFSAISDVIILFCLQLHDWIFMYDRRGKARNVALESEPFPESFQ